MRSFPQLLQRWSRTHAVTMIGAGVGSLIAESVIPLLISALLMFLVLILAGALRSEASVVSRANLITVLRLFCVGGLVWLSATDGLSSYWLAPGATLLLISDALDGWIARKHNAATKLGALLDEEVDAYFLLALCTLPVVTDRIDWWIIVPGLLRYAFVLVRPLLERGKAPVSLRSTRARVVFVVMMVAMITTLVPFPILYEPAAAVGSVLLLASFLIDAWRLVRAPAATPAVNG